ncbi:hypothetical protein N7457_008692 [Penicillium paradoxum]|uniref:uncharacterized protein n=1 Tax=Penicillium paradoxum TaxID=176176 RepID=UPI00254973E6|nr:uncharacterized protein N7457_008692 [Penicillium paradoxum]KAJ5773796.1 hypothetical protein N7457_008692 [Penicillium paradoxum]
MCIQTYIKWKMCNCIHFGRIHRCEEFGLPFFQRERCIEHALRVLNIGAIGIPEDRFQEKEGMCSECAKDLYREMRLLRWEWASRESEEWVAEQKQKQ